MTDTTGNPHVLLIEDEAVFADAACRHFRNNDFQCTKAGTLGEAYELLRHTHPDLMLLDMRLPDGSGLAFLESLRNADVCDVPVIVMTAYGALDDAVAAMKLNALDYLRKPVDLDDLLLCVRKALDNAAVKRDLGYSRLREEHAEVRVELIGDSAAMREVRCHIRQMGLVVGRTKDTAPTVLILGETGSGKDIVARMLHRHSQRHDLPFVHVDCASLPDELIEAELFGHVKGAYTGAHSSRTGLIEAAECGTVFLDEVAELPLELQAKLLAVLERRVFRRLGSSQEKPVCAWILAATNRPLEELVRQGRFRADLYYRLQVLSIKVPPLRQRTDDIAPLVGYFADQTARRYGLPRPEILEEALVGLKSYHWPGNVRELRNEVERSVLLGNGKPLDARAFRLEQVPDARLVQTSKPSQPESSLADTEMEMIRSTLSRTMGNISQAAVKLGITRMTLRYRMQKYGIQVKG